MAKDMVSSVGDKAALGNKVSHKVAHLLAEFEKEPVPDRLMELALQLQQALHDKLDPSTKD